MDSIEVLQKLSKIKENNEQIAKTTSWKRKNDLEKHNKRLVKEIHRLRRMEKNYQEY